MATTFNILRVTHFEQLRSYLDHRENAGWYYGNKEQFEKRHEDLKKWLNEIISSGVIIPKQE